MNPFAVVLRVESISEAQASEGRSATQPPAAFPFDSRIPRLSPKPRMEGTPTPTVVAVARALRDLRNQAAVGRSPFDVRAHLQRAHERPDGALPTASRTRGGFRCGWCADPRWRSAAFTIQDIECFAPKGRAYSIGRIPLGADEQSEVHGHFPKCNNAQPSKNGFAETIQTGRILPSSDDERDDSLACPSHGRIAAGRRVARRIKWGQQQIAPRQIPRPERRTRADHRSSYRAGFKSSHIPPPPVPNAEANALGVFHALRAYPTTEAQPLLADAWRVRSSRVTENLTGYLIGAETQTTLALRGCSVPSVPIRCPFKAESFQPPRRAQRRSVNVIRGR